MSDREVKTKQTFEEWISTRRPREGSAEYDYAEAAWTAALASVILPEGRFEVGMKALGRIGTGGPFVEGVFGLSCGDWLVTRPENVRPLPKTVELTVEEKLNDLFVKLHGDDPHALAWYTISVNLANGKTLDHLCSEYGVSTTKELS